MQSWDPNTSTWNTLAHGAAYNASGQITAWNEGDESSYTTLGRNYSATRGWLTSMTAGSALNLAYAYNDNGRVSTVTDNVNTAFKTTTYQYDNLNRLTQTPTGGTPYTPPSSRENVGKMWVGKCAENVGKCGKCGKCGKMWVSLELTICLRKELCKD